MGSVLVLLAAGSAGRDDRDGFPGYSNDPKTMTLEKVLQ